MKENQKNIYKNFNVSVNDSFNQNNEEEILSVILCCSRLLKDNFENFKVKNIKRIGNSMPIWSLDGLFKNLEN